MSLAPIVSNEDTDNNNNGNDTPPLLLPPQQQQQQQQHWTEAIAISTAEAMNAARRCTMEDVHVVDTIGDDGDILLVGVYDGHGGREMVDFLEHGLTYHVEQEVSCCGKNNNRPLGLQRAFLLADLHAQQLGVATSGATVALCLIEPVQTNNDNSNDYKKCGGYHVTTANVGDSRIVLGSINTATSNNNTKTTAVTATRLTTDHRLDDPTEVARIERTGDGFLWKGRVCGILAVTRSLGDQILKPYVIAHPSVREELVENCFLIVACDGLWDVLTDQEAVALVAAFAGPREQTADHLVQEALRRGTSDNVTAVIVWLP